MAKAVSPPPVKRRRLLPGTGPQNSATSQAQQGSGVNDSQNVLSIYSWNVNGIQPFLTRPITSFFSPTVQSGEASDVRASSLRDFLKRHGWPQCLFLQEVKINPEDKSTISAVRRAVKRSRDETKDAPDYQAHFCLPSDKHNARGFGRKVYGVCSIIRSDFAIDPVSRVRPVSWDLEGRVLVTETKPCRSVPKLAIFNIYAVNGTDAPYYSPETGEVAGTRHDRKLRVHKLLQDECRELESRGFSVILAGDINIARTQLDGHPNLRTHPHQHCVNRADFESRFFASLAPAPTVTDGRHDKEEGVTGSLQMIDTFRHLHPDAKGYTYYPRTKAFGESCDRVDMIIASRRIADNVVEAGMHETLADRGPSDHVPLYVKLRFDMTRDYQDHGEEADEATSRDKSISCSNVS